jgi:drug/metabolite transporter (DMT)-like permease
MIDIVSIILGIFLALIATICFSMGFVFQKKGLMEGLPELKFDAGIKNLVYSFLEFFKNKIWIAGFLLGIIGWVPFIIAVSLVGILVVQPITSLGLIIFLISAVRILGEKVRKIEIYSAIILGIAPILIAFSRISQIEINLYQFLIPFLIFFTSSIILAILFYLIAKLKKETTLEGIFLTITGVILNAIGTIFTNIFTQAYNDSNVSLLSWTGWAEILFGVFWFDIYHIWLCISLWGMGLFFLLGVIFYQSGFQNAKASIVYLIINSLSIIIPIIVGILVFQQQFENFYLFLIALGLILIGVINLSKFQAHIEEYEQYKNEEA